MLTIDEVVVNLQKVFAIQARKVRSVLRDDSFHDGPLYKKVQREWKKTKASTLQTFKYFRCEIDGVTGNELLRLLVEILNDQHLLKKSNCVLFSLNKQDFAAVLILEKHKIESITLSPPHEEDRGIFSFVFNNDYVSDMAKRGLPVNVHVIKKRRSDTEKGIRKFLHEDIRKTDVPLRYMFFGLLKDIALTSVHVNTQISRKVSYCGVPVPACVMLAVDTHQLGKLKNVFGQYSLDVKQWLISLDEEMMEKKFRRPTRNEKKLYIREKKLNLRMNAAKEIISLAIPSDQHGLFKEEYVERVIKDMKELYEF